MKWSISLSLLACSALIAMQSTGSSLELKITGDESTSMVSQGEDLIMVERIQDAYNTPEDAFARTSRPCPPFCVNPLNIEDGVATVAELDVIKFIEIVMKKGNGVMIDARTPNWYQEGTIPGAINIPYTMFEKSADDPELAEVLERLGAKKRDDVSIFRRSLEKVGLFNGEDMTDLWDFSDVSYVLLWCNGPWCGQSPRAIRGLVSLGFPEDKLYYYRGGMQMWQSLGLSVVHPDNVSTHASK
jgi:rhodanese-related sulfurtransferase